MNFTIPLPPGRALTASALLMAALGAGCGVEPESAPTDEQRVESRRAIPFAEGLPRFGPFAWSAPPAVDRMEPVQAGLRRPTRGPLVRPTPEPPAQFPRDAEGCHWLFRQDHLPTFHVELSEVTWRLLEFDKAHGPQREALDLDATPYHDVAAFRYVDEHRGLVVEARDDVYVRLRGNPSFWAGQGKFQFQFSFDEDNRFGHFMGLRKLLFDAAEFNRSFLRDRMAYAVAREAGLAAPCTNNARLFVNGEYYGLFTHVEKIDEVFLWNRLRQPTGDLWKRANWRLRTNEDITDDARRLALLETEDFERFGRIFHVPLGARTLAFEALLPAPDGAWAGGLNAYYYDDPHTGRFLHLPWDYDGAFIQSDGNKYLDPLRWDKGERSYGRPFYDRIVHHPEGLELYVDALEELLEDHYRPEVLVERIDRWQAQIEQAMLDDPNKPFDAATHYQRTDRMRSHVYLRARYLRSWIDCHRVGGMYVAEGGCGPAPEDEPYGRGD